MTLPITVLVEVAAGVGPFAAVTEADWTALSGVRSVQVSGGRRTEFDHFDPRTVTVVVDNRDRALDTLKPMRRLRYSIVHNGTTYPRFYGYIDALPKQWRVPRDEYVTITATDGFKVLETTPLLSMVKHEYLVDDPLAAWMLDEQGEATAAAELTAQWTPAPLVYGKGPTAATYTFGDNPIPGDSEATSLTLTPHLFVDLITVPDAGWVVQPLAQGVGPSLAMTDGVTVELAFRTSETRFMSVLFEQFDRQGTSQLELKILPDGWVEFTGVGNYTTAYNDGEWHHAAGVFEADRRTCRLYVDGAQVASFVFPTPYTFALPAHGATIGGLFTPNYSGNYLNGSVAAVALHNQPLSAARIAQHAEAVLTGFSGEPSDARVNRILDYAAWPEDLRDIDSGSSDLGRQTLGSSALSALRQAEDSERGALYMTRDGKVRFRARHTVLTAARHTTSQATFGDQMGELPYRADSLRIDYDDTLVRNDISATRADGVTQRAVDVASQADYGVRRYSPSGDVIVSSDHEMFAYVHWLLERYKEPKPRIGAIRVHPGRAPAELWPLVLGLDYGDRITVKRTPPGGGDRIVIEALIEAMPESVRPGVWEDADWTVSPAEARIYPVWKASAAESTTVWKASAAESTDVYVY